MIRFQHLEFVVGVDELKSGPVREYVGLCYQFPSLSYIADNKADAMIGILLVVAESLGDMLDNGELK